LLGSLLVYMFLLIRRARKHSDAMIEEVDDALEKVSNFKMILWLLIGGLALYFGSELLVKGAKDIASRKQLLDLRWLPSELVCPNLLLR